MNNAFFSKTKKVFKRTFRVSMRIPSQVLIGEFKKRKKTYKKRKRTLHTFNNKIRKLKSRYNRLSKGEKFKSKYQTFEDFLKVNNLKQVS